MKTALALLLSLTAFPAAAQMMCPPFDPLLKSLSNQGQHVVWEGIQKHQGKPREVIHTQSRHGKWTIIVKNGPRGCVVLSGGNATKLGIGQGV